MRLLLKSFAKRMPKVDMREALQAMKIHMQSVMQPRSRRRDHDAHMDRPLTSHFTVSVAPESDVQ